MPRETHTAGGPVELACGFTGAAWARANPGMGLVVDRKSVV